MRARFSIITYGPPSGAGAIIGWHFQVIAMPHAPSRPAAPNHYLVLANPSSDSFDHEVARTYRDAVECCGHGAEICDLNAMAFDPVLKDHERPDRPQRRRPWIQAELERLRASAVILFIYPVWFGGPPAILKGYVDRVLGAGCDVRRLQAGNAQPAVAGKAFVTITTSGAPLEWLRRQGHPLALREGWELYLAHGFGLRDAGHLSIDKVGPTMSEDEARDRLDRVAALARATCDLVDRAAMAVGAGDAVLSGRPC